MFVTNADCYNIELETIWKLWLTILTIGNIRYSKISLKICTANQIAITLYNLYNIYWLMWATACSKFRHVSFYNVSLSKRYLEIHFNETKDVCRISFLSVHNVFKWQIAVQNHATFRSFVWCISVNGTIYLESQTCITPQSASWRSQYFGSRSNWCEYRETEAWKSSQRTSINEINENQQS